MLAFKIKKGLIKSDIQINLVNQQHSYSTRNASNIYQQSFRTNAGKHLNSRVIAIEFNNLPNDVKNSETVFSFKKQVKSLLLID